MKKILSIFLLTISFFAHSQINYSAMKGEKINATYSFHFAKASYYNYKINASDLKDSVYTKVSNSQVPEEMLTQKFASIFANKSKIIVYSKFTFEYNNLKYSIIKFRKFENNTLGKIDYFITEYINNSWNEISRYNNVINDFKIVISLNDNVYTYFEVSEDNPKYADIKEIKSKSTDADGTLNIGNLAKNIAENNALFSKYIDK